MPLNQPDLPEIITAVRECLQEELLPGCEDKGQKLNIRICMNLLNTVERELKAGAAFYQHERNVLQTLLTELWPANMPLSDDMENQQLNETLLAYLADHPQANSDQRIINALYELALVKVSIDNPNYPAYKKLTDR